MRIRQSQSIEGTSKSATFKRDTMGHWFVTLVVASTMPDVPLPAPNPENVVGVDAGLKDFAVLSNGERIEAHQDGRFENPRRGAHGESKRSRSMYKTLRKRGNWR